MPDNHTQQRVYHYRSSAITNSEIEKPNANNLDFGEIAINYNAQEPSLFIKQNDSEIAQFVDKKYIEDNINSLSGLNDVNISSPMEEQSLVYDSVNNEYINKYALAGAIPYGRCDSSSTETNFTATVPGITELKDGTCMLLKNGVVNSTTGFTINVNGLGEKPVYNNLAAATSETTLFKSDYTILFIYDETRVSGGCWIYYRGYYASIGYQLRTNASTRKVTKKTGRYRILFSSPNNEFWVPATTSTGTTSGDVKTVNTEPINPFGRITYYGYTTVINSGSTIGTSYQWDQYNFYIGYSFNNVGTGLTLTYPKPVFVKCTPQQDGSAIIDSNTPYVQELPDTNDGKIYIYLGQAYSTTQIEMTEYHPVFYHDGNGIMLWTGKNIPNSLSELTNDTGYITSAATNLSNYASSGDVVTALGTKTDAAFKTIKVAGTSIIADSKDDTLTITAGANIGLVPNATNDSFVISATDTTYSDATTSTHGLMSIADKKKLNGIASGAQVNVQADWSETGTTSDAYIKNKPTIPTVNNNTITIQTNSNTVDTFTLNQSSDKTINIPIPTDVSDFTNDAGYITSADTTDFIASATVVAALDDKVDKEDGKGLSTNDYTTNEKNKLAGIQANAQKNGNAYKTVQVNASTSNLSAGNSGDTFIVSAGTNITLTAGNKKVTISAPSNISSFTNDAGYITSAVSALTYFATSSNTVSALNNKVDKVSGKGLSTNDFSNAYKGKLDNIASGAEVNVQSDWNVSDSNSDAYIKNKPTIGNAALTIQKNGTNVGSFSANQTTNKTINIAVPTTASDVNALPDSTKYAASLSLDINSSTYVVTAQLKDQEGNNLGTQQTIDLPLETMVVSGSYISSAKTVSLVLQNGNKIEFSVADLVSGLQTEITDSNKLSADLIENGNTNKVFTSSEKTKLSNLASSLATTSASGYMSSTQVTKLNGIESGAEVNVQSDWNETNSGSDAYILNKPNIQQIYTVEFEVRHDSTSSLLEDSIVSSNTSYSEILSLMNDGFEIKAHANFINDNEQIVYSIDMNRISSVGDFLVVFNGYILMVPYGSSEVLIAWDNNNSKWIAGESTPKLDVFYNDDQTPTVFSISLLNTDSIRIINEFQYLNDTNITNATSGDILTYHTNEYGGDGYWTNITPNFITSAVTEMTNYATSANVVSELDKKVETFECEFTFTQIQGSEEEFPKNCTITCNKTTSEIASAVEDGKIVIATSDLNDLLGVSGFCKSYWELTNVFDVEMGDEESNVQVVTFSVEGYYGFTNVYFQVYGELSEWHINDVVNSNDLDKVHNLQPVATAGTIGDLNDVAIYNSASSGQILQYDGTNWVNETLPSMPDVSNFITSAVTDLQFFATSSATVDALNNKVDKETGKGLSTNDFTNAYKGKLDGIASGAQVNGNAYSTIQVNGTTTNLVATTSGDTFIISAGTNVTLTSDSKKVIISALDTLPGTLTTTATTSLSATTNESLSGSVSLHKVAKTGSYNDLNDKPNLNEVISITYAELKQLKDSSGLTPNQQYRITNYHTYNHNYFGDGVANHDFDLIVRAISNNQLDVKASATQHNGDTYFSGISLNLWEIWYDLDANASINHTGLIYRMIDEYGNDCCYDFKNLLFYRKLNNDGLYDENGTNKLCYTFSIFSGGTCYDATHFPTMVNALHEKAIWGAGNCRVSFNKMFGINNVLLCAGGEYAQYCYIYNNTFEDFAYSNTIVCNAYLYNNTFKAYCTGITFNRTTSFEGNVFYPNTSGLKVTATNNDLTFYRNTVKSLTNVNITITSNDWRAYVVKDCLFKNISGATINNTSSLLSMTISQNSKQEVKIYNEADLVL